MTITTRNPETRFERTLPTIPSLSEASETYRALYDKLLGLYQQQADIQTKIQANLAAYRDRSKERYTTSGSEPEIPNERVAALLGEDVAQPAKDPTLSLREEAAQLSRDEADLTLAIGVMGRRLEAARMEASSIICRTIEPELRDLVSEIAGKMAELSHLALSYRKLADALNRANVAWSQLEVMGINVGGVVTPGSAYALWLVAAAERGYLPISALPTEILS